MNTENSGTEGELLLLKDISESDVESFNVICPGCTATICQLDTPTVEGFEAVCPGCGTALFPHNTLAVRGRLGEEVPGEEARGFVTKRWEMELDAGVYQEQMVDITVEGPVMEEVEVTDTMKNENERCAEEFGWDWSYEGNDE